MTSFITIFGGTLGNALFFMISGFLISTGYRDKIHSHSVSFENYLFKRLSKLYPMYILSNCAMLFLYILSSGPSMINLKRIVFTLLLQLGGALSMHPYNGPSWFLSALFLCYILYFTISYYSLHPTQYFSFLICAIAIGYAMIVGDQESGLFSGANGLGILNFCIGCMLAEAYPVISQKRPNWTSLACFLILAACGYLMLRYGVEIISGDSKVAFSFVVSPLLLYLTLDCKWISWLFQTKPIQFLGRVSISVFFWHYPVFCAMQYFFRVFGNGFNELHYPLYLLILILFSTLCYYFTGKKKAAAITPSAP